MQVSLERKNVSWQRIRHRRREARSPAARGAGALPSPPAVLGTMGVQGGRAGPGESPILTLPGTSGTAARAHPWGCVSSVCPPPTLTTGHQGHPSAHCHRPRHKPPGNNPLGRKAGEELEVEKPHSSTESRRRVASGESSGGGRGAFGDAKRRA